MLMRSKLGVCFNTEILISQLSASVISVGWNFYICPSPSSLFLSFRGGN